MDHHLITRPAFRPITVVPHELDDTHPLFGGEASTLYGSYRIVPPQPFTGRPEWTAWLRYSQERYDLATQELVFAKEEGGLYHFLHKVTGEAYSIPTHDEWNRFHREDDALEQRFGHRPKAWKKGIKIALLVLLVATLLVAKATGNSSFHNSGAPQIIFNVILLVVLIGTPIAFLLRQTSRPAAAAMPDHRMFYTPAELAQQAEENRRHEMRFALLMGGILGFFAFRHVLKHMREDDDG